MSAAQYETASPAPVDLEAARAFLAELDPKATFFTFQSFDDVKGRHDGSLKRVLHGPFDAVAAQLADLNARGAGIFVSVNATDGKGRKKVNIVRLRATWHDQDSVGVEPIFPGLPPSLVVETSPGKHHRWWFADGLKSDEHAGVMRTMVEGFGSDKNATSVAQVLRLPGFYHCKNPAKQHLVRVVGANMLHLAGFGPPPPAKRYTPDQLVTAFKYVPKPEPEPAAKKPREPGDFDRAKLFQLLGFIPADDRDVWLRVGLALHHESGGSAEGFELWAAWSPNAPEKFDEQDLERVWKSFDGRSAKPVTGGTLHHLARLGGWTGKPDAPFEKVPPGGAGAEPLAAPRLIRVSDFANREKKPRAWHIPPLVPAGQPTLLFGDGAVGKSLLGAQTAVATVLQQRWFGHEITNPGPVLYIGCEDDEDEMHRRFDDIAEQSGAKLADLRDLHLYCLAGHDAVLGAVDRNKIVQPTKLWGTINEMILDLRPTLVVFDTLADFFAGDENQRGQARQFIGMIRRPAIQRKCAALLLAHPSLSGMASGTGTSGSTGWSNSVRSRLYLTRPTAGEDQAVVDPDVRTLRLMKANYVGVGDEIKMRWQNGVFVPDVGKSAAVVQAHEKQADDVFLGLLRAYISDGRNVSPNKGPTYAPAVFAKDARACGFKRKDFEGAMNRLFSNKRIRIETEGPPSRRRSRLTVDEFLSWQRSIDRYGLPGLRATRVQDYRE